MGFNCIYTKKQFVGDLFIGGAVFQKFKDLAAFYVAMPKIPGMVIKWNERPNIINISRSGEMAYSIDTMRMSVPDSSGNLQTEGVKIQMEIGG